MISVPAVGMVPATAGPNTKTYYEYHNRIIPCHYDCFLPFVRRVLRYAVMPLDMLKFDGPTRTAIGDESFTLILET